MSVDTDSSTDYWTCAFCGCQINFVAKPYWSHFAQRWCETYDGFYTKIGTCPRCGRFRWESPPKPVTEIDIVGAVLARVFFYIGYAVEMHKRWVKAPWLTKPLCACHPDVTA